MLPPIVEPPVVLNRGVAPVAAVPVAPVAAPVLATTVLPHAAAAPVAAAPVLGGTTMPLGAAAGPLHKPTMGQRLKGAVKEVQGHITNNPATIEEGKLLAAGVDPLAAKTISHTTPTL